MAGLSLAGIKVKFDGFSGLFYKHMWYQYCITSYGRRQSLASPRVELAASVAALMLFGSRSSKSLFLLSRLNQLMLPFSFVWYVCKTLQVWACQNSIALKGAKNLWSRSVLVYTTCKYLEEIKYSKDFAKPNFYYTFYICNWRLKSCQSDATTWSITYDCKWWH